MLSLSRLKATINEYKYSHVFKPVSVVGIVGLSLVLFSSRGYSDDYPIWGNYDTTLVLGGDCHSADGRTQIVQGFKFTQDCDTGETTIENTYLKKSKHLGIEGILVKNQGDLIRYHDDNEKFFEINIPPGGKLKIRNLSAQLSEGMRITVFSSDSDELESFIHSTYKLIANQTISCSDGSQDIENMSFIVNCGNKPDFIIHNNSQNDRLISFSGQVNGMDTNMFIFVYTAESESSRHIQEFDLSAFDGNQYKLEINGYN